MLIQFSIKNFKTFKEKATLNFVSSNYDNDTRSGDNIHLDSKYDLKLLKSAVIFGANASGKSAFLEALTFMSSFAISSSIGSQKGDQIDIDPFRLSTESENTPTEFEVVFTHKEIMYRYGFEADSSQIVAEWLYHKPKTKEVELFYRNFQDFEVHPKGFSKGLTLVKQELIRNNALLLSVAAQFNDSISVGIIEWFKSLKTISGLRKEQYQGYTMGKTQEADHKKQILELLKAADLGIQDISIEKIDLNNFPPDLPKDQKDFLSKKIKEENFEVFSDVLTSHKKFNAGKEHIGNVNFSLSENESSGTAKFFALTGPILDVIENGYILVIDELDSALHPNLVCKIVSLFNSKELNPKNAQLIFNTHDTNLLSSGLFRRDQIWFTEKNKFGEGKLYSLADFKSVRKSEALEENYIRGKYGAVPFLGLFDTFIN